MRSMVEGHGRRGGTGAGGAIRTCPSTSLRLVQLFLRNTFGSPVPGRNFNVTARLPRRRLRSGALAFGAAPGFLFGGEPGVVEIALGFRAPAGADGGGTDGVHPRVWNIQGTSRKGDF